MDKLFDFSEEVSKGIDLIDGNGPENWRETFHGEYHEMTFMMSRCHCVLGIVFGDYAEGVDYLMVTGKDEESYGFCIPDSLGDLGRVRRYDAWVELGREWKRQLNKEDNS